MDQHQNTSQDPLENNCGEMHSLLSQEDVEFVLGALDIEMAKLAKEKEREELLHENNVVVLKKSLDKVLKKNQKLENQVEYYKQKAEHLERSSKITKEVALTLDGISEGRPYHFDNIDLMAVTDSVMVHEVAYNDMLRMVNESIDKCVEEAEDLSLERSQAVEYETVLRMMVNEIWVGYLKDVDLARLNSKISEILPERRKREKKARNHPQVVENHFHDDSKNIQNVDNYHEK